MENPRDEPFKSLKTDFQNLRVNQSFIRQGRNQRDEMIRSSMVVNRWTNFLKVFHAVIPKIPTGTREITRAKRILILTKSTGAKILESARGQGGQRY